MEKKGRKIKKLLDMGSNIKEEEEEEEEEEDIKALYEHSV